MKQINLKVFSLVLLVVSVALGATVSLVGNWGESDEELSCGSVGRLVATAEAIAAETGDGYSGAKISELINKKDGETDIRVRPYVRVGGSGSDAELRFPSSEMSSHDETQPLDDRVCETLNVMLDYFGKSANAFEYDGERALSVQNVWDNMSSAVGQRGAWSGRYLRMYKEYEGGLLVGSCDIVYSGRAFGHIPFRGGPNC